MSNTRLPDKLLEYVEPFVGHMVLVTTTTRAYCARLVKAPGSVRASMKLTLLNGVHSESLEGPMDLPLPPTTLETLYSEDPALVIVPMDLPGISYAAPDNL